jgi:SOS response regulatory protein OraA/RecX
MKVTYSSHALRRLSERNISKEEVEATISSPERTEKGRKGREIVYKIFDGKLLRVVYEKKDEIRVVTAYWSSPGRYGGKSG